MPVTVTVITYLPWPPWAQRHKQKQSYLCRFAQGGQGKYNMSRCHLCYGGCYHINFRQWKHGLTFTIRQAVCTIDQSSLIKCLWMCLCYIAQGSQGKCSHWARQNCCSLFFTANSDNVITIQARTVVPDELFHPCLIFAIKTGAANVR